MYTNTPPTEAHYYYVKTPKLEAIGKLNAWGVWSIDGYIIGTSDDMVALGIMFGPKIPTLDQYYELFKLADGVYNET